MKTKLIYHGIAALTGLVMLAVVLRYFLMLLE